MFYDHSELANFYMIPLGVFEEQVLWKPSVSIFNERRPDWLPAVEHIDNLD